MASLNSARTINMDGSDDPFFRYKMPAVLAHHNNKGKMKKTVLANIKEISESVGRPADYLITYLGQKLSASTTSEKDEKDINLSFVTGHHDICVVQEQILNFIKDVVMCHKCHNPETSCHTEGAKKHKALFLHCKACRHRSDLDSSNRFVKYMITHHSEAATHGGYGHAACAANATFDTVSTHNDCAKKKECPQCHYKTSKAVCGKCGSDIIAGKTENHDEVDGIETGRLSENNKKRECPKCHYKTSKPLCSKCGTSMQENLAKAAKDDETQDLLGTVRLWMAANKDSQAAVELDDFIAHVKTEVFVKSTTLEQLGAVVEVIAGEVGKLSDFSDAKLQPAKVAQEAAAFIVTWSRLVEELSLAIEDDGAVADMVIGKVQAGIASTLKPETSNANGECVVVGLLLALREVDGVADGLLEGCQRLKEKGITMNKFIEFLVEEADGDESEEDDDE